VIYDEVLIPDEVIRDEVQTHNKIDRPWSGLVPVREFLIAPRNNELILNDEMTKKLVR
jgi:hypothetical protein